MKPYAELLEFNQPNPIRTPGHTRIRDSFTDLSHEIRVRHVNAAQPYYFDPERIVEFAGRWDYGEKNAKRLGEKTTLAGEQVPIIVKYIEAGHESMLEMASATFFVECSRVVSHELVRHRLASFQQESQRFVKYDGEDNYDEMLYSTDEEDDTNRTLIDSSMKYAIETYNILRASGVSPQIARYVLPNAMRTRMVVKANLREWRHICKLRLDKSAQPEMQELMQQVYDQLCEVFPNVMHGVINGERGVR